MLEHGSPTVEGLNRALQFGHWKTVAKLMFSHSVLMAIQNL